MEDEKKKNQPDVKAEDNSIAVGGINIGGDVSGRITIGHGYTAEQVSVLITQISSTFQPRKFDGRCPYKGLEVFEEEDAGLFFGREKLVEDLVSRLRKSQTVFITGPSGSGKSSLVRAGLIPALKAGAIQNLHSERWLYETIQPGRNAFEALGLAFSRLKSPELARYVREHVHEENVLHESAESVLSEHKDQRLVLFIDQFEEVFTQTRREEERATILRLLTHAATAQNGRVVLLFAMRSDFVSNCAAYPALNQLLNQPSAFAQIGAMQPDELVSAIAQPALRVGLRIDPDLVAQIINDMQGEPGALPLMQFALKDLFDSHQAKGGPIALTLSDYLQRGGIHKSLERHADASFAKLDLEEQNLARSIFSGLIEIGRGTQDSRRTALFSELIPAQTTDEQVRATVQKLADARLITTDEQDEKDTVTLAHEKLIDAWPWLKKLVNENREVIALQNEIATDAKEWQDHKQDVSYLYTGARLAYAHEQLADRKLLLSDLSQQFLEAGRRRQQRSRVAVLGAILSVVALIILIPAVITYRRQSSVNHQLALLNERIAVTAQAANTLAVEQQVIALENAEEAKKQATIALANRLASQAQLIVSTQNSKQMTAFLLAVQSMKLSPSVEAAQVLQQDSTTIYVARMTHDDIVATIVFSPDGKLAASGGCDKRDAEGVCTEGTARVWEVSTGKEVARMTHDGLVHSIAFSPDSQYVISGSWDHTARVWETTSGREIARMTHGDIVNSVDFSADGNWVVSAGCDERNSSGTCTQGIVRVWEAASGRQIATMPHTDFVNTVALSKDGKYVVSASRDNTARVWEAASGTEVARMTHNQVVSSAAFSPDGKYVVSGGYDNTMRVWDATTGEEIARMTHEDRVTAVAFSPDGQQVLAGSRDNTARVWDVRTANEVARMTHEDVVIAVAFSPDSKQVISGSADGIARLWEAATGNEIAHVTHDEHVSSVAFSPDGAYAGSGSYDFTARVWGTAIGGGTFQVTHENVLSSAAFGPDGTFMVSGSWDNTARVWEIATGTEVTRMTHDDFVTSVAFRPDGRYAASGSWDYSARVWDAATGTEIARVTHDDIVNALSFGPDGQYVVSGSNDNSARVWQTTTGEEIGHMTHDGPVQAVAFSPDGQFIVSGGRDKTARVWEAATGEEVARMTHDDFVTSVAFSSDGKYVVSGSNDKTARVWEAATGEEVARMTHDDFVMSVAFSPDGKYVVSGSHDSSARVWEAATGQEIARLIHDDFVTSVGFSPNSQYVVSGSRDNTARVWEITGKEISRISHDRWVSVVAFSPDSTYFLSGSDDNSLRLQIWQPDDLIAETCSRLPRNLTHAEWRQYIGITLPYEAVCPNLPVEAETARVPNTVP